MFDSTISRHTWEFTPNALLEMSGCLRACSCAGASAQVIKQLMGHSAITVSQCYVHKLTECVERAMAAMEEASHRNN